MQAGSPIITSSDSPRIISPGLQCWFRGDSCHLTAGKVDTGIDLSGNGLDAVQASGAAQPVFGATSGPNGTPGWTFAAAQQLQTPAFNPASLQLDIYVVVQPTSVGGVVIATQFPLGATGIFESIFFGGTRQFTGAHYGTAGVSEWQASAITINTPHIVEFQHDKTVATEQIKIFTDGVLTAQNSVANANVTDPFGSFAMCIGASDTLTFGYSGVIAELFIYNQLLSAQQKQNLLRGYLGPRYGIAVP